MAKHRPRLKDGDRVKIVSVPADMRKFRGATGVVDGVRGDDRTWTVILDKPVRRGESFMVFLRHELVRLK